MLTFTPRQLVLSNVSTTTTPRAASPMPASEDFTSFLPKRDLFSRPSRRTSQVAQRRTSSLRSQWIDNEYNNNKLTTVVEDEDESFKQELADMLDVSLGNTAAADPEEFDLASVLEDALGCQFQIELDSLHGSLRRMPSQLAPSTPKSEYDFSLDSFEPEPMEPLPPLRSTQYDFDDKSDTSSLLSLYLQDFPSPPSTPFTPSMRTPSFASSSKSRSYSSLDSPILPTFSRTNSVTEKKKNRRRRPAYTVLQGYVETLDSSGSGSGSDSDESPVRPVTPPSSAFRTSHVPRPRVQEAQWDKIVDELFNDCDDALQMLPTGKPPIPPKPDNLPIRKAPSQRSILSRRSGESLSKTPTTPPRSILKNSSRPVISSPPMSPPSSAVRYSGTQSSPRRHQSSLPYTLPSTPTSPSSLYSSHSDVSSVSSYSTRSSRSSGRGLPSRPSIPIELLIRG